MFDQKFGYNSLTSAVVILADAPSKPIPGLDIQQSLDNLVKYAKDNCIKFVTFAGGFTCEKSELHRQFKYLAEKTNGHFIPAFRTQEEAVTQLVTLVAESTDDTSHCGLIVDPDDDFDDFDEDDFIPFRKRRAVSSGDHPVKVDASCTRLSLALTTSSPTAGVPAMMAISPTDSVVSSDSATSSTNIAIARIDNPIPGTWTVRYTERPDLSFSASCTRDLRVNQEFIRLGDSGEGISFTSARPVAGTFCFFPSVIACIRWVTSSFQVKPRQFKVCIDRSGREIIKH